MEKSHQSTGLLLVNLGTPEAPTPAAVRHYLIEFLSDRRVVEIPFLIWQVILRGLIAPLRGAKSAKLYQKIWLKGENQSPLRYYTSRLAEKLDQSWHEHQPNKPKPKIAWAMRYGHPSIAEGLNELQAAGCQRIKILPLYPHYCGATVASVMDKVYDYCKAQRNAPIIQQIAPFYDDERWLKLIATMIKNHHAGLTNQVSNQAFIVSFHGMPQRTRDLGDRYFDEVVTSLESLRKLTGLGEDQLMLGFQSRFGPAQWLTPSTQDLAVTLAKDGVKHLSVIAPGFFVDCLETLEELAMGLEESFHEHGGVSFSYVPCLNDSDEAVKLLADLATD